MDDREKDPAVVLPYLVGRQLAATEVYEAFGYRRSAYYKAAREGRLISADNLIRAAKYFGLNPVDLQIRFGLIEPEAVGEYVENLKSERHFGRVATRKDAAAAPTQSRTRIRDAQPRRDLPPP